MWAYEVVATGSPAACTTFQPWYQGRLKPCERDPTTINTIVAMPKGKVRMRSKPANWVGSRFEYWYVATQTVTFFSAPFSRIGMTCGRERSRGWTGYSFPL